MNAQVFPALLMMTGRAALVVGAGPVATRRVHRLLAAGAHIRVVAPAATADIRQLADARAIEWHAREFTTEDLDDMWFVVTATGVAAVDALVSSECERRRVWCVNSAQHTRGSAAFPAVGTGPDAVTVAVYGGGDPGRSIALRDAIQLALQTATLPIRPTRRRADVGRVTLVGAGPGDPDLVTVRARQAIALADVLVVDRLAPAALWRTAPAEVAVIDVGKAPGRHAASQADINQTLVEHAQAGKHVVRIKGGDPFVLGRGGEEALACIEAGIPVEVVPGITSAVAVPAAAGIPVTHRSVTASFVVASAHEGPTGVVAATSGAPTSATLVLLMGAGRLAEIASALIAAGRSDTTPVAVIESGWTAKQRTTVTTLAQAAAGTVEVQPPAVVVVGQVVKMRSELGDLGRPSRDSGHG